MKYNLIDWIRAEPRLSTTPLRDEIFGTIKESYPEVRFSTFRFSGPIFDIHFALDHFLRKTTLNLL